MGNLKFVGNCDKFTWIPKAGSFFRGQYVSQGSDDKNDPAGNIIYLIVLVHVEYLVVRKSENKKIIRNNGQINFF